MNLAEIFTNAPVVNAAAPSFDTAMTDATAFFAQSLSSFLGTTLTELSGITSPDIASHQFLSTYAAGSGIAMFVLVVTLARLFYRTSAGEMSGQALAHSLGVGAGRDAARPLRAGAGPAHRATDRRRDREHRHVLRR